MRFLRELVDVLQRMDHFVTVARVPRDSAVRVAFTGYHEGRPLLSRPIALSSIYQTWPKRNRERERERKDAKHIPRAR